MEIKNLRGNFRPEIDASAQADPQAEPETLRSLGLAGQTEAYGGETSEYAKWAQCTGHAGSPDQKPCFELAVNHHELPSLQL